MARILLTNDDGFQAASFSELVSALAGKNKLDIVVPSGQRSWIGKALTRKGVVSCRKDSIAGVSAMICDGTPADCVLIGLGHYSKSPDMVVAGINIGSNVAHFTAFGSGTVGAAIEAAIHGVFGVAFSSHLVEPSGRDLFEEIYEGRMDEKKQRGIFGPMALIASRVISRLDAKRVAMLRKLGVHMLNVNVPYGAGPDAPWEITPFHEFDYGLMFERKVRDDVQFHDSGHGPKSNGKEKDDFQHGGFVFPQDGVKAGTDLDAVSRGSVSITPMTLRADSERLDEVSEILG